MGKLSDTNKQKITVIIITILTDKKAPFLKETKEIKKKIYC